MARPTKTVTGNNKFKSIAGPVTTASIDNSGSLVDPNPFYSRMVQILKLKHPELNLGVGVDYHSHLACGMAMVDSIGGEDQVVMDAINKNEACPVQEPATEVIDLDDNPEEESDGGPETELELGFPHDHPWFLSLSNQSAGKTVSTTYPEPTVPDLNWDNWQEPPVADPKVGVNGLLFGIPPPAKMLRGDKSLNDGSKKSRAKTLRGKKIDRFAQLSSTAAASLMDTEGEAEDNDYLADGVDLTEPASSHSPDDMSSKSGLSTPNDSLTPITKTQQSFKQIQRENFMHSSITHLSEKLTKPSNERRGIIQDALVTKPRSETEEVIRPLTASQTTEDKNILMTTPTKSENSDDVSLPIATPGSSGPSTEKKRKRIKFSSPKKPRENPFGFGAGPDLSGCPRTNSNNNQTYDDPTKYNDDSCAVCGGIGRFLCCESCPKSFHFTCVNPPLDENSLPRGDWFCQECTAKNSPSLSSTHSTIDVFENNKFFGSLLRQLARQNPVQFVLPKRIIERFDGISVGKFGEYQDNDLKLTNNSIQRSSAQSFNGDAGFNRIYDKTGTVLYCYCCGDSAVHGKIMTQCDYCPLAWHLDCLNPPLSSVKTLGKKWKCPNHADIGFKKLRRPKKAKIVDVDLIRAFRNDGNIEILDNDDEIQPPLNSLPTYASPESSILSASSLLSSRRPLTWNSATHVNDDNLDCETLIVKGVTYLLLDPPLKLDFYNEMTNYDLNHSLINDTTLSKWEMNPTLKVLDELILRDIKQRECVRNLAYLQTNNGKMLDTPRDYECFSVLIQAASEARQERQKELEEQNKNKRQGRSKKQTRSSRPISSRAINKRYGSQTSTAENIPLKSMDDNLPDSYFDQVLPSEVGELSAIKKLMQLKGKEALLQFLNDNN
ncbi:hypothetical protein NADFUDRAFT_51204 [Nadsonia fulvescens var. elongata DSM 6958]|uniref:PHD-type domain-containing protein n=1 Tax=Nadsonia fulvescens var. elongata DSM 6958 TaxID=857566 RepID=A0A1E3PKG8_9ASCO|nr:hypothetical protein NADFUDRAFT_51204 [Nadsonia fulvescens var. elongata DSM 6958]